MENNENNNPNVMGDMNQTPNNMDNMNPNPQMMNDPMMNMAPNPQMMNNMEPNPQMMNDPMMNNMEPNPQMMNSTTIDNNMINTTSTVVDNNVPNEYSTTINEEPFMEEKPKNKAVPIIIFIVLVILIGCGGFFAYQKFMVKPYKAVVDSMFSMLNNSNVLSGKYTVTTSTTISSKDESLAFLNGVKLDTVASQDQASGKRFFQVGYSEDAKKLLDVEALMDNNKIYVDLKDIYDKVLSADLGEVLGSDTKYDEADINYLVDVFHRMLNASLKDEKNNRSSVTVKLNGNDVKLTANKYIINNTNQARITNNMMNVLLNDSKAISILAKYTEMDAETLKKNIKDSVSSDESYDSGEAEIIIYTKGLFNNFAGLGMTVEKESLFNYYVVDGYSAFIVDNEMFKFNMEGKEDNQNIKMVVDNEELVTGNVSKKSENNYKISLTISKTVTIDMDYKLEMTANIKQIDTTKTVDINDLKEEDQNKIIENLTKALGDSKIYKAINEMQSSENNLIEN